MIRFKRGILMILLGLVLSVGGCASPDEALDDNKPRTPAEGVNISDLALDFQYKDSGGKTVFLSDFRGKPVLLNFWATWCYPCRSEMPYLQQVYQEWSGRGLVLLTVNIGESASQVDRFFEAYNLTMPVVLDTDKSIARKYNVTGIPTSLFIDKDGIIQQKVVGAFPNKEVIEQMLTLIVP